MADFPFIVDIDEQNLTEILQQSLEKPLVINFYAPTHKESADLLALLEQVALPTTYLFKEAQALDAFPGALDKASLIQRLSIILPKEEDLKFQQALDFLQVENYEAALPLLKDAWELSDKKNSDVALLYAETYIAMKKTEPAQEILKQIPLQDRDSRWHGLQAQIELQIQAADTPEIQQLQADYAKNPTAEIAIKLAVQLHQAGRNEEALTLLFGILKTDLGTQNGEVKQQFLSILSAMGNADPLTNKFRRLLYSLLY